MACRTNRCKAIDVCGCISNCGSGGNGANYSEVSCGVKEVVRSYPVQGGRYRQVKYSNGCCARIAKTWVPQNYNGILFNGPRPLSCRVGGTLNNTASECMDTMNGMFNSGVR